MTETYPQPDACPWCCFPDRVVTASWPEFETGIHGARCTCMRCQVKGPVAWGATVGEALDAAVILWNRRRRAACTYCKHIARAIDPPAARRRGA